MLVFSNHESALLAHQCTIDEKIARVSIAQILVIEVIHKLYIEIFDFI